MKRFKPKVIKKKKIKLRLIIFIFFFFFSYIFAIKYIKENKSNKNVLNKNINYINYDLVKSVTDKISYNINKPENG